MDKLWILGRSSECQNSHRSESVLEQLKDTSDANATYRERVGSRDGGISCNRHYRLNTPPQEMEPTQGMKRNTKKGQEKDQGSFYV